MPGERGSNLPFSFISLGPTSSSVGFFSTWGYVIVAGAVVGFLVGIGLALAYGSIVIAVISVVGLVSGSYIGFMGPKIEESENQPSHFAELKDLEDRVQRLEAQIQRTGPQEPVEADSPKASLEAQMQRTGPQEPVEADLPKMELAKLEADYARIKPHLSEQGEKIYQAKLQEARRKAESDSSKPSG
jgi:hypothetical protein